MVWISGCTMTPVRIGLRASTIGMIVLSIFLIFCSDAGISRRGVELWPKRTRRGARRQSDREKRSHVHVTLVRTCERCKPFGLRSNAGEGLAESESYACVERKVNGQQKARAVSEVRGPICAAIRQLALRA